MVITEQNMSVSQIVFSRVWNRILETRNVLRRSGHSRTTQNKDI